MSSTACTTRLVFCKSETPVLAPVLEIQPSCYGTRTCARDGAVWRCLNFLQTSKLYTCECDRRRLRVLKRLLVSPFWLLGFSPDKGHSACSHRSARCWLGGSLPCCAIVGFRSGLSPAGFLVGFVGFRSRPEPLLLWKACPSMHEHVESVGGGCPCGHLFLMNKNNSNASPCLRQWDPPEYGLPASAR